MLAAAWIGAVATVVLAAGTITAAIFAIEVSGKTARRIWR